MITLGIIEDDPEIRQMIGELLESDSDFHCQFLGESAEEFFRTVNKDDYPQVILLDIGLPGISGINALPLMKERYPEMDVIILTIHDDSHRIFQALQAGASGYLLKNSPHNDIKRSLQIVSKGGSTMSPRIARQVVEYFQNKKMSSKKSPLTPREKEIVLGLVEGMSYKMIADKMGISLETVRVHIKNIYSKLQVHSKAEVIRKSLQGEI